MVPAVNSLNHHHHHRHQHRNRNIGYNSGDYWYGGGRGSHSNSVVDGVVSQIQQQQQGGYDHYTTTASSAADHQAYLFLGSDHNNLIDDSAADHPMVEDESRTNSLNTEPEAEAEAEPGSSPRDHNISIQVVDEEEDEEEEEEEEEDIDDEGWLQLSVGSHTKRSNGGGLAKHNRDHDQEVHPTAPGRGGGVNIIELDLLPGSSSQQPQAASPGFQFRHQAAAAEFITGQRAPPLKIAAGVATTSYSIPYFFNHQQEGSSSSSSFPPPPPHPHPPHYHNQEINWALRPPPIHQQQNIAMASPPLSLIPFGFGRPLLFHQQQQQQQQRVMAHNQELQVSTTSSDFRIIDPPRRPHSGIWFMLLASQIQPREPFLPQIPKSFLRIKDGGMTVRSLKKYLVNKLTLDNESEVEITCRGRQLQPCLTLQHVRDHIWTPSPSPSPSRAVASTPTPTADHLMLLHYATSSPSI